MDNRILKVGDRTFALDDLGCLQRFDEWKPQFAESMASEVGITPPLGPEHWKVIKYLREAVERTGRTPIVHRACRDCGLKLRDIERLFPTGFHRGACRLAGLNYFERYTPPTAASSPGRTYLIDERGFLVNPDDWDERFARQLAEDSGLDLTEAHWQVIRYLRAARERTGAVPPVHTTCRACNLELEDLERLFPRGYQRQAVKLAGLSLTH